MSKYFVYAALYFIAFSAHAVAEEEQLCPEGQIYDPDFEVCVDVEALE